MKSGILSIHKPEGISSARVVAQVKKVLGVKKVGHTGTLDPFATGLLLCAINKGTKISRFFLDGHKRYLARICLGVETDTYDLTGKTVFKAQDNTIQDFSNEDITSAITAFIGIQDQVAPAFSALKHEGQPLYKLARQGIIIQKPPRRIEIFDIRIQKIALPYVDVDVFCSSGTYIRSLAFDIGRKLGCGAHLSKLCRTTSSVFKLEDAIELTALEKLDKTTVEKRIISLSDCLEFMSEVQADRPLAKKIKFGQKLLKNEIETPFAKPDHFIKVVDDDRNLLAVIQLSDNGQDYNYCCVFSS
ncbi:MAG: tRNA pseudouridine(55) synthase TruB [Proteobacteria bacterium]|nr:tRNA pseudouridine(55) synthase TruB [Pseudomonadota bacterium]MBU1583496.1 tRNA pseudouridine(55) synthase TruB [Pseudomonadota bacterium]MBU2455803.1 tRNA pseudouridine(55) synthase TruB [Pseudomonadota bacterium]MBU2631893.1 tRNA pseudouridine(55) synthase TruB [Pseudomonadota bacterium]